MSRRWLVALAVLAALLGVALAVDILRGARAPTDAHVVAGLDAASVTDLRLLQRDATLVLRRAPGGWTVGDAPADAGRVRDLLDAVRMLTWRTPPREATDAELAERGLSPPVATIEVAGHELRLGREEPALEQTWVAVRRARQPWRMALVDTALVRPLTPEPADLRRRNLVDLDPAAVKRLEVGDTTIENGCVGEGGRCLPADPRVVTRFLEQLADARFSRFVDAPMPPVQLHVVADEWEVSFHGPCPGLPEERLARSANGTGCVHPLAVPGTWIDGRIVPLDPRTIDAIELGGVEVAGDPERIREYAAELTAFEATAVEPAPAANPPPPGPGVIRIRAGDAETVVWLEGGGSGGGSVVRRAGVPARFLVNEKTVNELFFRSSLSFLSLRIQSFDAHAVTAVERTAGGATQRWQRGETLDAWSPPPADPAALTSLLETASDLRAQEIVAETPEPRHGLDPARVTLVFTVRPSPVSPDAPPTRHTLHIGTATATGCYARADDGPVVGLAAATCANLTQPR